MNNYNPTTEDMREMEVVQTAHSVSNLMERVMKEPLKYEEHLSLITDIMLNASDAKSFIISAMAADSRRELSNIKSGG